ncbi:unnamed protein product [Meganyctiphanes norvegica]|uniref:Uncharacterized protein n=1 Tax=Meganyctiphanes norvegica TaxID=48144 RepID=A0AAV2SYA3_MEGNR
MNLLRETMYEEKPLLLTLTETWLHDHSEAEVYIENYNLFRKDRSVRTTIGRGRHVGGVALYVGVGGMAFFLGHGFKFCSRVLYFEAFCTRIMNQIFFWFKAKFINCTTLN